jgi:hypothetical protein
MRARVPGIGLVPEGGDLAGDVIALAGRAFETSAAILGGIAILHGGRFAGERRDVGRESAEVEGEGGDEDVVHHPVVLLQARPDEGFQAAFPVGQVAGQP